jgi:hypothetical protein
MDAMMLTLFAIGIGWLIFAFCWIAICSMGDERETDHLEELKDRVPHFPVHLKDDKQ